MILEHASQPASKGCTRFIIWKKAAQLIGRSMTRRKLSLFIQPLQNKSETQEAHQKHKNPLPSKLIILEHASQQEMGILPILSISIFLLPQIQTLRIRTRPTMCLKQHLNNNKLKLMVNHTRKGSPDLHFSLLSTEKEDDHKRVTFPNYNPTFGFPFASCNELVLRLADYQNDEELALWNPSTNKVIQTLPQPPRPPASVVYDEYANFYGLGLDPKTDDYKVIRNLEFEYEDPRNTSYHRLTELYSLKTDSWKHIACPHGNFVVVSSPIYINGFSYWPVSTHNDFAIMSFDFAEECFTCALIPGPCAATYKTGPYAEYEFLLAEYEGSLAVVVYLVKDKLLELWAWNNDNDNQSWSRRGEWAIPNIAGVHKPLGFFKNDQFYFEDFTGELVLFDCTKQKLKNLGLYVDCCFSTHIFPYYSK